jgi:endonuclease/exonuclease/phosphatase family metal-dependent hydrolase
LRIAFWNIECFDQLFSHQNTPRGNRMATGRLSSIAEVIRAVDPDILGIAEAPNTSLSEKKQTTLCLQSFAEWGELRQTQSIIGFPSPSERELALMFDPNKATISHEPGGRANTRSNPRFDGQWYLESSDAFYTEALELLYPPLEAKVAAKEGDFACRLLLVYARAKGSATTAEATRWKEECERSHRRLLGECAWYRRRVDEWLDAEENVVVIGDLNDGPSMDFEKAQTCRRGVEVVMGDVFSPERLLRNYCPQPKWIKQGWKPSSARYQDQLTHLYTHALTDHILVSQDVEASGFKIWNPYEDEDARAFRDDALEASDHFPVSVDVKI